MSGVGMSKKISIAQETTLRELEERYGADKKLRLIGEDEDMAVFICSKRQQPLHDQNYSFEVGM